MLQCRLHDLELRAFTYALAAFQCDEFS
jgi:hypothetical protein